MNKTYKFLPLVETYSNAAFIEQEIATRLLAKFPDLNISPQRILDLGCATGQQTSQISKLFPAADVIGLDIAYDMVKFASNKNKGTYVCTNAINTPFANQIFDVVFANCIFPYIPDINLLALELKRILKPNGVLLFTSYGPDSFAPIQVHSHNYIDMHDLGDILHNVQFYPVLEMEKLYFTYNSLNDLTDDLIQSGHTISFDEQYMQSLCITTEVIYGTAWNDANQHQTQNNYFDINNIKIMND